MKAPEFHQLTEIGKWADLCRYYECDGIAWSAMTHGPLVNRGPIDTFRANFAKQFRGELYPVSE